VRPVEITYVHRFEDPTGFADTLRSTHKLLGVIACLACYSGIAKVS
jgi:hypothetical protein